MGLIDSLTNPLAAVGAGVSRIASVFRDAPEAGPTPTPAAAPAAPAPAALATTPWRQQYIDANDFQAGETWRSGDYIRLAQFLLPEGTEWRLERGRPYGFYVKAVQDLAGQNLGAPAARNVVINDLQKSTQAGQATLPATYHPDVAVWATTGSGRVKCTITNVDYTTKTITFTEPAGVNGASAIQVYYLSNDGDWRIRVARELGVDTSIVAILNDSFAVAHAVDQLNRRTARYWPQDTVLVQKQRLVLEVRTTVKMVWTPEAENILNFYAWMRQLKVLDDQRLGRVAEGVQRRGF
ncbi:hypothetical protein Mesil_1766 [Allomeiothermus silvanus DSM 9946]|uniref:VP17 central beta-barrel domain-containing protein n=1 Tax=Allomeiothermus silvanus (strain ATCC 700542 / DSM 9946 / NBRC 106475 / NCIMB 13440 / VI-R2) TaxID=526227 RepID=D7BFU1_ALLS1|nr:hypothetical protein [Allomeiothermus silvanus]ADH63644.1 hypothetical protein Mesil_1766 [Allomeiothermus silvanus DSM 9946]